MRRPVAFVLALVVAAPALSAGLCAVACDVQRHHEAAANECHAHARGAGGAQTLGAGAGPCHDLAREAVAAVVDRLVPTHAVQAIAPQPLSPSLEASWRDAAVVTVRGAPPSRPFVTRALRI
jgi:hypothetical protein